MSPLRSPRIAEVRAGHRVLSAQSAASTDGEQEPAVELEDARPARRGAWAPRALCVLLAACGPELGDEALTYDARTGYWDEAPAALEVGDEYLVDGHLYRVTADGVEDRGEATVDDLAASDETRSETWVAEAAHRVPDGDEWVLVLGAADDAGHRRLAEVEPGDRFAFQGRVFDTTDADGDGRLEVHATGEVIRRVVNTFVRHAPEVIDAEITYADGTTDVLTGTPNHPFWVDAVRDYVPLGELRVGTQLHVQGGGAAILVSKTWRQGDFEVFDFEVEGLHNFYVRGPGGYLPGVLVHNSSYRAVETPYAPANQAMSAEALGARSAVEEGATLYRTGTTGRSAAAEGQFWSLESPLSPDYAARYGVPAENVANANFIEGATLRPGTDFVTRPAPPVGTNPGGGIEVVVPPGGVDMSFYTTQ